MGLKDDNVRVRVDSEIRKKIEEICEELDIPISQFIREAIRDRLRKENKL